LEAIVSHITTDFDGLASMVAAKKLYPRAKLFFPGTPEQAVKDFMNLYKDFIEVEVPKNPRELGITKLIIVDSRNPNRLGNFRDLVNDPLVEVHIYDHHPPSYEDIKGDENYIENVGATTTMLMKKIIEKNLYLTPLEATLMTLGIYEETGSLMFADTTPDDATVVADLLKRGVNLQVVSDFIFHHLNDEQHSLLSTLLLSSYVLKIKGYRILIARAHTDKFIDGLALITHRLQDLERMDAVFTLVEMVNRVYLVARSIRESIDVNRVANFFDGGGHPSAASAVIRNMPLVEVEEKLKKVLKRNVHPLVRAADIMTKPVQTLNLTDKMTLNDAYEYMHKVGCFHLPIIKDGKLVGIVDRRDVEKAGRHGYGNAPLEIYMSKPVVTARPDASIYHLQNLLMEKGVGSLPIMEDDRLIGIVTRSDVLEAIYQRDLSGAKRREKRPVNQLKTLPMFLRNILKKAGMVGDRLGMGVYVVGGFVRDLLLGVENLDVDIVVEGDGMLFGKKFAEELCGRVKIHERFGTSIVVLPDGMHIDVATSRTEFYTRPAALPEVLESSIKQDLFRRDFTINAMAIRLNRKFFGELLDFFGCRKDLRNGVVRVLHPMSFIDDPTRILRAVKFEQRYHFRMDQSTENLLKDALSHNIFEKVSAERLRNEFIEILEESRPLPAIKRMNHLKILKLIHPDINLNSRMVEVFNSVSATLLQFREIVETEDVKVWVIYFNILVMYLTVEDIEKIGEKFRIPSDIVKRISFDRKQVQEIFRTLADRDIHKGDIHRALRGLSLETLIFLIARSKLRIIRTRIVYYLTKLRHIKPIITGKTLIEWKLEPGPAFRKILELLFESQLDGLFTTEEGAKELYETRLKALVHE
jgi:tRNA nucleotidyltransferase (CCA-adding enzyme)